MRDDELIAVDESHSMGHWGDLADIIVAAASWLGRVQQVPARVGANRAQVVAPTTETLNNLLH